MLLRIAFLSFVLLVLPTAAGAVTIRDIIELSKAGLADEVLIAVIDADRTIFTLDAAQILELKKAGVSQAVVLKMLRTRREFDPPASAPAPSAVAASARTSVPATPEPAPPEVIVIGSTPPPAYEINVRQYFFVPFPLWGPVVPQHPTAPPAPFLAPEHRGFGRFINDGWIGRP